MTTTAATKRPRGRPRLSDPARITSVQGRSKVPITVELPADLLADIDHLARARRWTRTALVIAALEKMLEQEK